MATNTIITAAAACEIAKNNKITASDGSKYQITDKGLKALKALLAKDVIDNEPITVHNLIAHMNYVQQTVGDSFVEV